LNTDNTAKNSKRNLRRILLDTRSALQDSVRKKWDSAIYHHIIAHLKSNPVQSLGVYWPIQNEPDLRELYDFLFTQKIQLSLPDVVDKNSALQFLQWQPGEPLIAGAYDIAIPEKSFICMPEAVLVPCVGFTQSRYRIGYGGGFFDRTLKQYPKLYSIGIAYACQLTDFETDAYDTPLSCLITENGVIP